MQNTTTGFKRILGKTYNSLATRLEAPEKAHRFLTLLGRLDPGTGESIYRLAILQACFALINWLIN